MISPESCILDIAPSISILRNLSTRANYVAVDYSPSSDLVLSADIRELPFPDESFDVVLCSHVLEHVRDSQKGISELCRVIRDDGLAFIQIPYRHSGSTERLDIPDEHGHVWNYDRADFVDRLERGGLVVNAVNLERTVSVAGQFVFDNFDIFVCSNPKAQSERSDSFTQYIRSINRMMYRRNAEPSTKTSDISHAPLAT